VLTELSGLVVACGAPENDVQPVERVDDGDLRHDGYVDIASRDPNLTILERTVNGQPGLVAQVDDVTVTVFAFDVVNGRINRIWAVRNPEKLRMWTAF
jgi:RNA polymerase sigma-70 factor (ECF subfamily)